MTAATPFATTPPSSDFNPGFLAFIAFISLAIILWLLMRNMNARMRRMSYRQAAAGRARNEPQATEDDLTGGPDAPTSPITHE